MAHAARLAAALILGAGAVSGAALAASAPSPAAQESGYAEAYAAYVEQLVRFLRGDREAADPLLAAGAELCRRFDRCDAERVAAYYLALDDEELAAGRRADAHFTALWEDVRAARGMTTEEWRLWRPEVVAELEALAERVAAEADFVPAARALSLLSVLEVDRVERDPELTAPGREGLADELLDRAETLAQESLELFERAGMLTPSLEPRWTFARVYRKRGQVALAREAYGELIDLARLLRNDDYRQRSLRGLMALAEELGDLGEADELLRELADVRGDGARWYVTKKQARQLLYRDEPAAAIAFLAGRRPDGEGPLAEWHELLAGARLRAGDARAARREYERLPEGALGRRLGLARVALHEGRARDALEALDDELLARLDLDRRTLALVTRAEARLELGDPAAAVAAVEAALAAADVWRLRVEGSHTEDDGPVVNVLGEVVGVHAVVLLARAYAELGRPLAAARAIEELQSRTLRGSPAAPDDAGGAPRLALSEDDLVAWAAAYELGVVTWAIGSDASLVVHVAPDGDALALPVAEGRRRIDAAVRRLREAAIAGNTTRALALAEELCAALFPDELAARLVPRGAASRLLCLPHGPLERLPLELLVGLGALDEELVPVVLPGLPAREPGEPLDPRGLAPWTLLGAPTPPISAGAANVGGEPELPGARTELAELARLLPDARSITGDALDRDALARALAGDGPVHVASHFVARCADTGRRLKGPGLLLAGGDVFCPADAWAARPRLPLVVLAACESQSGRFLDAQGMQGFARALLDRGTRNLLVTLWPVEDGAARAWSLAFHRELAAGRAPSRAAAAARDELRSAGYGAADWAAFRLLGRD